MIVKQRSCIKGKVMMIFLFFPESLYGLSNFIFCCFPFCGGGGGVKILTLNLFHSLGYFSSKKLVIFVEFSPENRI